MTGRNPTGREGVFFLARRTPSLPVGFPPSLSNLNMKLTSTHYIIAAAAFFVITIIIATQLWSDHKIASLERDVETAKAAATEKQTAAEQFETQAAEYKAKTEYLEQQIAEINAIATKQNEELEKLSKNTDSARRDVEHTRNIRSVAATANQLCAKLAELGHKCN